MSQYPPQQQQPPYPTPMPPGFDPYAQPPGDGSGPAKRASTLMFVLGGLIAMFGACGLAQSFAVSSSDFQAMIEQQQQATGQKMPFSIETLRTISTVLQGATLVIGLVLIASAVGVRRGGRGAMVGGIVISCGVLLLVGVLTLLSFVAALMMPLYAVVGCFLVIPLSLFGLVVFWLAQALRGGSGGPSAAEAAMRQYQMQMWYYQQQQQAYQQQMQYPQPPAGGIAFPPPPQQLPAGYGYGQPQQQPSPPQPPPPQPQWRDPNAPPPQG